VIQWASLPSITPSIKVENIAVNSIWILGTNYLKKAVTRYKI
jgi:hypothetical protein